ncbi:MAG: exosortase/archaeosortase family protein [Candidatus Omnitrophota bacterium]
MKKLRYIEIAVIVALLCLVFKPVYGALVYRFTMQDSYYSHGFLIPLISGYLVFKKRDVLRTTEPGSGKAGLIILAAGLIMHVIGVLLTLRVASYFAIPISIFGIVLYLGGAKFAKELAFPIAFLVFMLPLPKVLIVGTSFKMKIFAAQASVFAARSIGIAATRAGSTIYYPGGEMVVGDPCSGLSSLISFLALGALFTQITTASFWKRNVLFASAIPVALFSNLLRLTFLILVGFVYGQNFTHGWVHDFAGIMVFVVGFICMFSITKILRCRMTL